MRGAQLAWSAIGAAGAAVSVATEATATANLRANQETSEQSASIARERRNKVALWISWWCLAAVRVYRLVTAIPREIRLSLEGRDKEKVQSGQGDAARVEGGRDEVVKRDEAREVGFDVLGHTIITFNNMKSCINSVWS